MRHTDEQNSSSLLFVLLYLHAPQETVLVPSHLSWEAAIRILSAHALSSSVSPWSLGLWTLPLHSPPEIALLVLPYAISRPSRSVACPNYKRVASIRQAHLILEINIVSMLMLYCKIPAFYNAALIQTDWAVTQSGNRRQQVFFRDEDHKACTDLMWEWRAKCKIEHRK
jgi:hypothetical protein